MNKKGFLGDVAFIIAILFALGLTVFVMSKVLGSYNDSWQANTAIDSTSKQLVNDSNNRYAPVWDGTFMLVFGLLGVFLVLSVVTLASRPEFFPVVVIVMIFLIGAAGLISNAFSTVTNSTDFTNQTSAFSFTTYIMGNLPVLTLFMCGLLIIGFFMKIRGII